VDEYHSNQPVTTRCVIITLKDKNLQPKEYVRTIKCTTGLPKESNFYGNRVTIVGKFSLSVTANKKSNTVRRYSTSGATDVMSRLEKLRLRSENRPNHTINANLHSMVYNVVLLNQAYSLLKSKPGNITPGIVAGAETLDGMSHEVLLNISESLKNESFEFKPSPKASGELRPLTIASPRDKIVQQAIKMILEAIFEPLFHDNSHGFRPNRSCHTALKDVIKYFPSVA